MGGELSLSASPGVGNTPPRKLTNCKSPEIRPRAGGGGGGAWLQDKLNHAVRVNSHYRATFACVHTSILCE